MILSIMIPTIHDRIDQFRGLMAELHWQIYIADANDLVEIVYIQDNRELTIGEKRNMLLDMAQGEYVVGIDDDDMPAENYVEKILAALESKPDCVGFNIEFTTNGENPRKCIHSMKYTKWHHKPDQSEFYRGITQFNPVKRELALKVKFPNVRFCEDQPYSEAVTKLCKREVFIDEYLLNYRYTNNIPHNQKYGIK